MQHYTRIMPPALSMILQYHPCNYLNAFLFRSVLKEYKISEKAFSVLHNNIYLTDCHSYAVGFLWEPFRGLPALLNYDADNVLHIWPQTTSHMDKSQYRHLHDQYQTITTVYLRNITNNQNRNRHTVHAQGVVQHQHTALL